MNTYDELRSRIAQGWTAMFFCVMCGFLVDLIKSAVNNDFSKWVNDPGPVGMKIVSVVMVIYIIMPVLVRSVGAAWFRWTLVGLTVFFGLFFVAHQVAHALTNSRPFDIIHAFDFAHHGLVIWMVTLTARWARQAADGADEFSAVRPTPSLAR
jgi:hypothetical protein